MGSLIYLARGIQTEVKIQANQDCVEKSAGMGLSRKEQLTTENNRVHRVKIWKSG
jgi:hypothetical protein